jgi:hypothetical protein
MEPTSTSANAELQAARARRVSLRAAMQSLEHALAAPAIGRAAEWTPGVSGSLQDLRDCMAAHIAGTEGPNGFHREMVTAAPRLVHQVEVSVREHGQINALIDTVRASADESAEVDDIRETGTQLLGLLARHRQRGADMIFEAYESDLGGED